MKSLKKGKKLNKFLNDEKCHTSWHYRLCRYILSCKISHPLQTPLKTKDLKAMSSQSH